MLAVALAVVLAVAGGPEAPKRSSNVKAEFRKLYPCPSTAKYTGPCPGFQIDHREALICGGKDEVSNLQWLDTERHKEKTRVEVKLCRPRVRQ